MAHIRIVQLQPDREEGFVKHSLDFLMEPKEIALSSHQRVTSEIGLENNTNDLTKTIEHEKNEPKKASCYKLAQGSIRNTSTRKGLEKSPK